MAFYHITPVFNKCRFFVKNLHKTGNSRGALCYNGTESTKGGITLKDSIITIESAAGFCSLSALKASGTVAVPCTAENVIVIDSDNNHA